MRVLCIVGSHDFPEDSWICVECGHSDPARRATIEQRETDRRIVELFTQLAETCTDQKLVILAAYAVAMYFVLRNR